eukprot:TRINITY_DN11446_c0_g1_i5.p1 TRINITY_DN11446_c0_g1~~TRINITY_DN11446_c0_g1_i5.p1  ORF type:complete len:853 (+),score=224.11 TRINITY_DN11446_c0_g1_i5:1293-3851(+)
MRAQPPSGWLGCSLLLFLCLGVASKDANSSLAGAHGVHGDLMVCPSGTLDNMRYTQQLQEFSSHAALGDGSYLHELEESAELEVFALHFKEVETPLLVSALLLLVYFLRVAFQSSSLGHILPDSCMVIGVGILVGFYIRFGAERNDPFAFSADSFFLLILPPIIFEAGYLQCNNRVFMENVGTILINAIFGTAFNTFAVGFALFGLSSSLGIDLSPAEGLVFGALIAAVDPVAVLTVFEEMHVNDTLHTIVFGESILNDGVAVVLYRICVALAYKTNTSDEELDVGLAFGMGIASFVVVFVGGLIIGIVHGVLAAFVTRFFIPESGRVMEPFILILIGYISYLVAEIFHFSGIVSIMVCGMLMKHYAAKNIQKTSRVSIQYFLKMISATAETLIFILLGVEVVTSVSQGWHTGFIIAAYFLCLIFRAMSVFASSLFINRLRRHQITFKDQCVIAYGGLRGAIAFALAFILLEEDLLCSTDFDGQGGGDVVTPFRHRNLFVSATIFIVMITVFVQGTTIKPVLNALHIRMADEHETAGFEKLNLKLVDSVMRVIEVVSHVHSPNFLRDFYWRLDARLHHFLVKPGGDYKHLLERAEDRAILELLRTIREDQERARNDAEEKEIDEKETNRMRWQQTHDNFRNVIFEIDRHKEDLGLEDQHAHSASTSGSPSRSSQRPPHHVSRALLEAVKSTSRPSSTLYGNSVKDPMHSASARRNHFAFDETDEQEDADLKRFDALLLKMYGQRPTKRSGASPRPSQESIPATVLTDLDRSRNSPSTRPGVPRSTSDSQLAPSTRAKDFIAGNTWVPNPNVHAQNGYRDMHPTDSSERLLDGYELSPDDLEIGLAPIRECAL